MSKSTVNNEIMQFENQELRKRCEALASQVRLEKERADSHQAKLSRIDVERGRSVNDDQVRNVANMLGSSKIELQEATELILVASDRNDKYLANTSKLTSDYLQAVELIAQLGCKIKTAEHAQSSMEAEIEQLRAKISDLTSRLDSALKNVTELRTQEQKHQEEARRTREQSNALKTQLEEERGRSLRLEQDARKRRADQLQDLHEPAPSGGRGPQAGAMPTTASATPVPPRQAAAPSAPQSAVDRGLCRHCKEGPYGLMVRCAACGWEHHSACARKVRQGRGAASSGEAGQRFLCTECCANG